MSPSVYPLYGWKVASEVPLPAEPLPEGGVHPDVTIRWGAAAPVPSDPPDGVLIARRTVDGRPQYTASRHDGGWTLRFHGACDLAVGNDATVADVFPDPAFSLAKVPVLLAGTGLAFLLAARGRAVFHGAVVAVGGGGVAFIGPSGSGKSTLAAICCAAGATFVSDDLLVIDGDDPLMCAGGGGELRLRPGATGAAELLSESWSRHATADARLAVSSGAPPAGRLPLVALIVPRLWRAPAPVVVDRLASSVVMRALLRCSRIEELRDPAMQAAQFSAAASLGEAVPTYAAEVPWGPTFSADVATELLALVLPS